jgi:uridine kinase
VNVAATWDMGQAVAAMVAARRAIPRARSALVAVSGIDGSGKGYLTAQVVQRLRQQRLNAVGINVDGWLNLPQVRFNPEQPAEHFYRHAIRFDEMFERLILPLKVQRTHSVLADFAEETAPEYRKYLYTYYDVDVIVLEGIYLLKRAYRRHYDVSLWIECSFETALERALRRGQEGLPPLETIQAYETIYFPAQCIHFAEDDPRSVADGILVNDPRLVTGGPERCLEFA